MLSEFFARLRGATLEQPLPPLDTHLAMAALLVRVARADEHYAFEEIAEIDRILAETEALNPVEAAKLRATAERIEAEGPDTETFTALVQTSVPYAARRDLFHALWDVSLADRALRPEEQVFLAEITTALGISPEDAADAARRGAEV